MPAISALLQRIKHQKLYVPTCFTLCCFFFLLAVILTACASGGNTTNNPQTTPTTTVSLGQIHWCGKPSMLFRDDGASTNGTKTNTTVTPTTINDWNQFKTSLGFTLYLPATLPQGTCLSSAFGTVHDAVFGSSFTIGFMLPNHDPLTFSEAPLRSQDPKFQCSATTNNTSGTSANAKQTAIQLCTGARNTTNVVFSARGSTGDLQNFFQQLQPDVNWLPAA